jgi:hypothetical protein
MKMGVKPGITAESNKDQLQVKNNSSPVSTHSTASTKRKVLAATASIFDPLGLLSPAVITYKLFLQRLWLDKFSWDDQLRTQLQEEWNQLLHVMSQLSHTKFHRRLLCANAINIQIHGFCDSSQQGL